ncbi:MAG: hypothetical protein Q9194_005123 [Teloschistes cf. exilis]
MVIDPEAKAQTELKDFSNIFSLDGKVAVVTGGSRGLGLHAASGLLQAGCSKVYITSRKAAVCESACAALNALPNKRSGAQAISVPADSAKISGVEALVKEVLTTTDHVDILFANAGATWGEKFDTHPDSAFAKVMDLNVKSVFNTIRLFAPLLEKNATQEDPSRVIVTASIAGLGVGTLGEQATFGYSASKAAVIHLTRNLAVDLGPRHVLCNSIAPGFFPSKMASGLMAMQGGEAEIAKLNPNGRLGRPEDVAAAVVYLSSRASSHINGGNIVLDGGALWGRASESLYSFALAPKFETMSFFDPSLVAFGANSDGTNAQLIWKNERKEMMLTGKVDRLTSKEDPYEMDPVFKFPASPGTPLFPVSPERANRQLPQSPSLPSDLHESAKIAHIRENTDVQNKVAQFNSLSKEAVQRRKENEAAMKRAVLGREEAENETRRLKDENKTLRRELDEGKAREKKVAERIESVMEELHRSKESQVHAQSVYEKEVRRARKEAFKSSSALVKTQEELKTSRNRYTLMREEVEVQRRKVERTKQETFTSQYQLVGLQEEVVQAKQQIKVIEEERDALKTNLAQEEAARIAAEGKIALPPAEGPEEFGSPKRRRRESLKENIDPNIDPNDDLDLDFDTPEGVEEDLLESLKGELRAEKRLRKRADGLIEFMKMECQFNCCPCRIAEQQGTRYVHDGRMEEQMKKILAKIPKKKPARGAAPTPPPAELSESAPSSPPKAASPLGQTTEMLINFSPSTGTSYKQATPAGRDLPELLPLPRTQSIYEDSTASSPQPQTPEFQLYPPQLSSSVAQQEQRTVLPKTPRPLPLPPTLTPHITLPTIRSVTYHGTTTTTTVPLAPIPVSPERTISREEALEQIRQRRGRARSIANGNGTPRKPMMGGGEGRRDLSAPAR